MATRVEVDLDASKPETDEKQYRLVKLNSNALEALLISDLRGAAGDAESSEDDESCDEEEEEEEEEGQEGEDEAAGPSRRRRAAVCCTVGVGSFSDPEDCQGLAHFLEHMLFMGSAKYPKENAFDSFLSKNGGHSNAYTEGEHTSFFFTIKVGALEEALDIFAQFFVAPLMLEDAVDRELNAIESEFQLARSSASNRLQEIACLTTKQPHPLSQFGWGNLLTLRERPQARGVDPLERLRTFYDTHYVAQNMRIAICAPLPLEKLEGIVARTCSDIRSRPRDAPEGWVYQPADLSVWGPPFQAPPAEAPQAPPPPMDEQGEPGPGESARLVAARASLGCVFYVVPIMDIHRLRITWQLPCQVGNYRSKPGDYLSHLLGHESAGSALATAKANGWATSLVAGGGEDGYERNTGFSLFPITVNLTRKGAREWRSVVALLLEHVSLLRAVGPQKWVYDEQASVSQVDYRFLEEGDPEDTVQELAANMQPQQGLARQDLLSGPFLFEEWAPDKIEALLDCFTLDNMRVDFMSCYFGRDRDFGTAEAQADGSDADDADDESDSNDGEDEAEGEDSESGEEDEEDEEDEEAAPGCGGVVKEDFEDNPALGPEGDCPQVEPYFGTRFWARRLSDDVLSEWQATMDETFKHVAAQGSGPTPRSGLHMPPKNPFVPTSVAVHPLPDDAAIHPLVGAFVKVRLNDKAGSGKKKRGKEQPWMYGFVHRFNRRTNRIVTCFEDDINDQYVSFELSEEDADPARWLAKRATAQPISATLVWVPSRQSKASGCPATFVVQSGGRAKSSGQHFGGLAAQLMEIRDGESDPVVRARITSGRMPVIASCFVPQRVAQSPRLQIWALQDRVFLTPKMAVNLNVICGETNRLLSSALNTVASDLFISMVGDSLTDQAYLASMAELEYGIHKSEAGIRLRFFGFSDKLMRLVDIVLAHLLQEALEPTEANRSRFAVLRESLMRSYRNSGLKSSKFATSLRLRALKPNAHDARELLSVLEGDALDSLEKLVVHVRSSLLEQAFVDGFLCGNVDMAADVPALQELVERHFAGAGIRTLPASVFPAARVTELAPGSLLRVTEQGRDPKDSNSSLELYFQIGPDNLEERVVLDLIEHFMEEPIYDQLRTKRQLGYSVSCGTRLTNRVMGFAVRATSATHTAAQLEAHALSFLVEFRATLKALSPEEFEENVQTLVDLKLEEDNNMGEGARRLWNCIASRTFRWFGARREAFALLGVTPEDLLACYDKWLLPTAKSARAVSVLVEGVAQVPTGEGPAEPADLALRQEAVPDIAQLHASASHYSLPPPTPMEL